jgi:2-polyprenyl-3-methyl-5-hydroxy-6-metoxy-1,4-benzoquinol methylase
MSKTMSSKKNDQRRTGDTINIEGDYQYRAFNSSNIIQRFWHQSKVRIIQSTLPVGAGEQVLDVGCGSGVITDFLGSMGANVVGIDANPDGLEFATSKFTRANIRFSQGLVDADYSIPYPVDKIYCLEVIEHIHYHQGKSMLQSFDRALKPGGFVFLTTPNYGGIWPIIERIFDFLQVTPKMAGEQHVEFYNIKKLKYLCQETSFRIVQIYVINLLAPWIAPFSWNLAIQLERFEVKARCPLGANLVFILRKTE